MNVISDVQFYDKYSRYRYDLGRREDWIDTITRVTNYLFSFDKHNVLSEELRKRIFDAIYNKDVMPSMRNLAMAGAAAERTNICSYNCAAGVPDDTYFFREAVLILMAGTGLGYSVEKRFVEKLPRLEKANSIKMHITVEDTTEGWADAVFYGINYWILGHDVEFDVSKIRPAGSPLKIKGGQASGSTALVNSLSAIEGIISSRREDGFLRPIDVHDIMCYIAKCIVSGGVRRSAMICLFDLDDMEMMNCKSPGNIENNLQRYLSNNSVVLENELSLEEITAFMNRMFNSYAGEPGIFSRYAIANTIPERRNFDENFLTNPCAEIVLRPGQFCNLSSVVCRPEDTKASLNEKVEIATIIGTLQSMADYFPGLRPIWKENQVEERLLGVDLNGIMDCPMVCYNPWLLESLKEIAIHTNAYYADLLGINRSAAITCVKPSGNASVLLNTSPGIHARWSKYYIRRMQLHKDNPILAVLQMYGVPTQPSNYLPDTYVAEFPIKSPDEAVTVSEVSAIDQLETWKSFKRHWTEHNPSCTISYSEDDKEKIIEWVYSNQGLLSGLSFLPKSDAVYEQMPYQAITETEYNNLLQGFPKEIDWNTLHSLESGRGDNTSASQVSGCDGEKCLLH